MSSSDLNSELIMQQWAPIGRPAIFDNPIRGQNQRTSDMVPRMPLGCSILIIWLSFSRDPPDVRAPLANLQP